MIAIRRAEERGRLGRGTATSYLTFSCDQFKDPEHTGFRALRAINATIGDANGDSRTASRRTPRTWAANRPNRGLCGLPLD